MFDLRKANRWKLPTVSYCNFYKEFPNARGAFRRWLTFKRYWSGRLWCIGIRQHEITIDFRMSPLDDMAFPDATKQDRQAVADAIKNNS